MRPRRLRSLILGAFVAGAAFVATLGATAAAEGEEESAPAPQAPVCARSLGTVTIADGDRAGWTDLDLPSPNSLLRAIVQRSRCFQIVEANNNGADYVLLAEVTGQNEPARQSVTQMVGSVVDNRWSGLVRDAGTPREGPQALLSLTRVSDAERAARTSGRALDQNPNWNAPGTLGLGAPGQAWEENEIARTISAAFIDAYAQMVTELGGLDRDMAAAPEAAYRARNVVHLRAGPATDQAVLRRMPAGAAVHATGASQENWLEVTDEFGLRGWVRADLLEAVR